MTRHASPVTEPSNKTMPASIVGILCFEMAKTMCRLVSLYKSVTDEEIQRLKTQLTKSVGVAYLNSKDDTFLLGLACSERLEDLHRTASTLSRLAHNCSHYRLDHDTRKLGFRTKGSDRIIQKMERYVAATWVLFSEMERLHELEGRERSIQQWKKTLSPEQTEETYFDTFEQRIEFQRKEVRRYKQISLWDRTFDECVGLMARVACTVYARINNVFGRNADISVSNNSPQRKKQHQFTFQIQIHIHFRRQHQVQNRIVPDTDHCLVADRDRYISKSAPKQRNSKRVTRSRSQHFKEDISLGLWENPKPELGQRNRVYLSAPRSTVGGSGLTVRYANVILVAKRCLNTPGKLRDEERAMVYEMLPARLKAAVMAKLRTNLRKTEAEGAKGESLATGWREAVEGMMRWLVPMAVDTMRWQAERNLVRQNMGSKPTVLLLQTLHFSDLEKTEAAITEVLVGLSCMIRYEHGECGGGH